MISLLDAKEEYTAIITSVMDRIVSRKNIVCIPSTGNHHNGGFLSSKPSELSALSVTKNVRSADLFQDRLLTGFLKYEFNADDDIEIRTEDGVPTSQIYPHTVTGHIRYVHPSRKDIGIRVGGFHGLDHKIAIYLDDKENTLENLPGDVCYPLMEHCFPVLGKANSVYVDNLVNFFEDLHKVYTVSPNAAKLLP